MLKKKWILIPGVIILIAISIGIVGQYLINKKLNDVLSGHIIEEQLGNKYQVDYTDCHFSLIRNKLIVDDLRFSKIGEEKFEWTFSATDIDFEGFRAVAFLMGEGFGLDKLIIENPVLSLMHLEKSESTRPDSTKSSNTVSDLKISIGAIVIQNGNFKYDPEGPEEFTCKFGFILNKIDFKGHLDIEKLWDNSGFDLSQCRYQFPDSIYVIDIDRIDLPEAGKEIGLDNLHFHSNLSKAAYPKNFGWCKPRMDISVPHIQISRPKNFSDSLLVISKIKVDSLVLEIHKDSRYPWIDRVTDLPQVGIKNIPLAVDVDSILANNSKLTFITVFPDGASAALNFTGVSASIDGFQNIDSTLAAFTLNANATFMEATNVVAEIKYMYGKNDPFECKATMSKTRLDFMSNFLQSAAGIRISSGMVDKLELHMTGTKYGERGYVDFYYNDLQVEAVDKESGDKKWLLNVGANLADGVLFWRKNPDDKHFRRGEFQKERVVYKGFPAQWIDGLFAGILNSVSKIDPARFKSGTKTKKKKKK